MNILYIFGNFNVLILYMCVSRLWKLCVFGISFLHSGGGGGNFKHFRAGAISNISALSTNRGLTE